MSHLDLAAQVLESARRSGATGAECTIAEGEEFTVQVRLGEVENLKEAGSRAAGIRVLLGHQVGSAYTSDLTRNGLESMVASAVELAKISTPDPYAGLPAPEELGKLDSDLALYWPETAELATEHKIAQAREAEAAAMSADPRITNSEGAAYATYLNHLTFANSLGFAGEYRGSRCMLRAVPVAKQGDALERDSWFSLARRPAELEAPEVVGKQAAARVLRRLGARKLPTQSAPVVFEPRVARSLLDHLFDAVSGSSVYRRESFLSDQLGQKVAAESVTVIDDGTLPGLFGSSPFDDEGVPSRRTVVIDRGILRSFLLNSYTGRKLRLATTGNAARGIAGNAGVGHGNFYLEPGQTSPEQIIASLPRGLYVTELLGFGVNVVTGDYSRGAAGIWIENGEMAYPVSEVTIAGNLKQMLYDVEAIGSDLEFRGTTAAPTLLIRELTISGK